MTVRNRSLCSFLLSAILLVGFALTLAVAQDRPIRVGGNVAAVNRVSWVNPVYPPEAKRNRIQGTVQLEILIDKEGHVAQMSVVSGPAQLIESATDAVHQWVYKPTLLNGEPVSVLTTVDVTYTLSE